MFIGSYSARFIRKFNIIKKAWRKQKNVYRGDTPFLFEERHSEYLHVQRTAILLKVKIRRITSQQKARQLPGFLFIDLLPEG